MSGSKIRLFVAMDIPEGIRRHIAKTVDGMRGEIPGARWVQAQNLHITLKFIGNYEEEALDRLSNEIRVTAERCRGFKALLGECGAFPSPRKARVIWLGMSEGAEEASRVARKLDARLEKVGVQREGRRFRGHLTLARLRQPRDCAGSLEKLSMELRKLSEMPFEVGEVALYRSILGPQGPTYIALARAGLGGLQGGKD